MENTHLPHPEREVEEMYLDFMSRLDSLHEDKEFAHDELFLNWIVAAQNLLCLRFWQAKDDYDATVTFVNNKYRGLTDFITTTKTGTALEMFRIRVTSEIARLEAMIISRNRSTYM